MPLLERCYVRIRCLLHVLTAPRHPPQTEAEAIRRMVEWARREGERYRAGKG